MKFSILFLLISIGGCLSIDDRECFHKEMDRNCPTRSFPTSFPETEEELREVCQQVLSLAECSTSAREECGFQEERAEASRKIIVYLREICDEDKPFFKAVSSNLDCISPAVDKMSDICDGHIISEENEEKLMKVGRLIDDDVPAKCFNMIEEASCPAITIGYFCENEELKEAVLQALGKIFNTRYQCPEEMIDKLVPVFEVYQTILLEELALKYATEAPANENK